MERRSGGSVEYPFPGALEPTMLCVGSSLPFGFLIRYVKHNTSAALVLVFEYAGAPGTARSCARTLPPVYPARTPGDKNGQALILALCPSGHSNHNNVTFYSLIAVLDRLR